MRYSSSISGKTTRRQLFRRILSLASILAAARAAPALANSISIEKPTSPNPHEQEESHSMTEIVHLIKIRASQESAFQAMSTVEGIRNWWTRDAVLAAEVGGAGEFGFYDHRMVIKIKIAELMPPHRVAWEPVSSTGGSFDGTTISFDLKSDGDVTSVLFAHRGFKSAGENVASATTRWGFYLLSLKRYLETGKGSPNPEDTELIR